MAKTPNYKKSLERKIVIAKQNNGGAVTGDVTDIEFLTEEDSHNLWNGTQFIPDEDGEYEFSGNSIVDVANSGRINAFVDTGSGATEVLTTSDDLNSRNKQFNGKIKLNAGDILSFRYKVNGNLTSGNDLHTLIIQKVPSL